MYIKKVWAIENASYLVSKATNKMIPDGCLEIILIKGQGACFTIKDLSFPCQEGVYLGGQLTASIDMEILPQSKLYFLKIYPWISPLITSFPISKTTNSITPFSEINSQLNLRLHPGPFDFNLERCVKIFEEEVEKQSPGKNIETNVMLKSCTSLLDYTREFSKSKKDLLLDLKISSRTLENRFNQYIGLSPKQFANTMRLRRVVEKLLYGTVDSSLSAISLDYGFFDQAHFIRSFKSIMGAPPTKLSMEKYFIPNSDEQFRFYTI
ncbi:helix-turn-helix domain-containing protein [Litoribacter populi]|uniref:helix-turn-helix domain-containing protein n=1 Tax=Litoribacter populi TaxID=2598460 RepID=UPI00117CE569|nr:helix-turn-helix domain-containing protein [Litoribacter populi]